MTIQHPALAALGQGRCFVIGEVASTHDGSLGLAHAFIDAIAAAGGDAVKFQTHIATAESTPGEPFRVAFSRQDASRYDYWKRMEFTAEQWAGLATHARERGLAFLSSPFSDAAFDLLERLDVPAWKVAAGELTNAPMLERMAMTGKPVLLSSGLARWDELDEAVAAVRGRGAPVAVFQTTSKYPCPPESVGLNVLDELRARYDAPVGLSDHSGTIYAGLAAVALGADMVEVHAVLSRESFGPDVTSSLEPADLARLVEGIRFIERARAHPVEKDAMAEELAASRALFGKSVVAARDLASGHRLEAGDVALKKPGGGFPPARLAEVVGRTLKRAVPTDAILTPDDLE
jgi:N-acetylneuraminate synthase